eukprot:5586894-Ditylum_brightwellii.AAC.1
MSPEEEVTLQDRGSPEAVVKAVLTGVFPGVQTNGAFAEVATAAVADVVATDNGVEDNQEEEQIDAQVDDNQKKTGSTPTCRDKGLLSPVELRRTPK